MASCTRRRPRPRSLLARLLATEPEIANQLGFALQLCAFRYPGRLLWSDEAIPALALRFVADQLGVAPGALTAYGTRPQTRREQLDALRAAFGFAMFAPEHKRELLTWLLPVTLGTADTMAVTEALMGELRTVLDTPRYRARAAVMADEFRSIDTRSEILRVINQVVCGSDTERGPVQEIQFVQTPRAA
jgi:hypothetical protein